MSFAISVDFRPTNLPVESQQRFATRTESADLGRSSASEKITRRAEPFLLSIVQYGVYHLSSEIIDRIYIDMEERMMVPKQESIHAKIGAARSWAESNIE